MKYMFILFATLLFSFVALADPPFDSYQVRYANLNVGDSYVNLGNSGANGAFDPTDNICANVYVFDSAQELISCCACPLSPMHLKTFSVKNDLVSNTLTPGIPTAVTVALVATSMKGAAPTTCNASNAYTTAANLVSGLGAWMTTPHVLTGVPQPYLTETPFLQSQLNQAMLTKMTGYCGFIQANGSGFGVCKPCRQGAQGPAQM